MVKLLMLLSLLLFLLQKKAVIGGDSDVFCDFLSANGKSSSCSSCANPCNGCGSFVINCDGDNKIAGIGASNQGLTALPESFGNLTSLKSLRDSNYCILNNKA